MSNLVLYRKYRPKSFADITGQEHVVTTLSNALASNMTSHAYLFCGPRGSGKTSIARIFAKALNCEKRKEGEFEPCNACVSCLEINEGHSMDLMEIDAASNRGVDEIRELRDGIKFRPAKSKYKVFIIDESHQLTKEAANALLKTLEEPPSHAVFILATTEIHKMIPTIVSRCQRFDFRKLTLPEIISRLEMIVKKEKANVEKTALELIALNSGGALRDAEGLLDQALTFSGTLDREGIIKAEDLKELLGMVDTKIISDFVDFLCQKNGAGAVKFLNEIIEKGKDVQEFSHSLINYLRQGLISKIGLESSSMLSGLTQNEQERLKKQMVSFNEVELRNALRLFMEAENKMKYSSIVQLPLELAIVEILKLGEK
jgi:DNA polymerase-3 subunit gamma/tau